MSPNFKGALLMVASMVAFTLNDMFIKLTGGAIPLPQLLSIRGTVASVMIIALALALGGFQPKAAIQAWPWLLLRSVTEVGAAYFFLSALFHMPLGNVIAILQILPLSVALGAYLFLSEPLGWRRLLAIAIGFCGMLLIVRPGPDGFSIWSLYALMAVVCVTARDLVTRQMPRDVPSLTIAVTNMVVVAFVFTLASLTAPWEPVTPQHWGYILGSAVFIIGGYYFSVQVMRVGEISFIAPFRYTSLVSALIIGLLVFDEWPDGITLLGAVIVVATGLFALYRERMSAR